MEKLILTWELRDINEKVSNIRANKKVPAIMYGHKSTSLVISVNYSEFLKIFRKSGTTHIVELTIDGKKNNVLIHEVQKHPVTGNFLHIDFFMVSATEKIHVQIPIVLVGESEAQKQWAMIEHNIHTLDIKCLPKDLVDVFEVDIASLKEIDNIIHVRDMLIDVKKFDILSPLDGAIVSAHLPRGTKEETIAEVVTPTEESAT